MARRDRRDVLSATAFAAGWFFNLLPSPIRCLVSNRDPATILRSQVLRVAVRLREGLLGGASRGFGLRLAWSHAAGGWVRVLWLGFLFAVETSHSSFVL